MTTLISDTFASGSGPIVGRTPDTTNTPGNTWAASNVNVGAGLAVPAANGGACLVDSDRTDFYAVEADIVYITTDATSGVIFRAASATNYLGIAIVSNGSASLRFIRLIRFDGSLTTVDAFNDTSIVLGNTYTVRAEVRGTEVKAFINGTERTSWDLATEGVNDNASSTGCGMRWGNTAHAGDNFTVEALTVPAKTVQPIVVPSGFVVPTIPGHVASTAGGSAFGTHTPKVVASVQPNAQDGETYTYTPGGARVIDDDEQESSNFSVNNFVDGVVIDNPSAVESISVDDADATGIIGHEADPQSGTVASSGGNFHSFPSHFVHGGALVGCHPQMFDGLGHVSVNNVAEAASLPIPDSADLEYNDAQGYHDAYVGVDLGDIALFLSCHHNERLYAQAVSSISGVATTTPVEVGPDRNTTYIHAIQASDVSGDKAAWVAIRDLHNTGSVLVGGSLVRLTVDGTTVSSNQVDHLTQSTGSTDGRMYPRDLRRFVSGGNEYVAYSWINRGASGSSPPWASICIGYYDVTNNRWKSCDGDNVGRGSLGTTSAPRFSAADTANTSFGGGGGVEFIGEIVGGSDPQRYGIANYARPSPTFATSGRVEGLALFADWDNANPNAWDSGVDIRLAIIRDTGSATARYVTNASADALGLNATTTARLSAVFVEDAAGNVKLVVTEADGTEPSAPGTSGTPLNYGDFGARTSDGTGIKVLEYDLTGVFDVASDAAFETFMSGITPTERVFETGRTDLGVCNLSRVEGVPGAYVGKVEVARLGQQQTQAVTFLNPEAAAAMSAGWRSRNFRARGGGVR